ncbi:hypothetical protein EGM70_02575 [Enterobacteriaceae bacterium 89]|nr:hypothetical protein [Enterobacteriaceae bacterium 89]
MKRSATALLFGSLLLTGPLAHADIIDDAIGNIQQALSDAYKPDSDRVYHDDRDDDDSSSQRQTAHNRQYDDRYRQLEDRRHQLDERQRQLDQERQQIDNEERQLQDDEDR